MDDVVREDARVFGADTVVYCRSHMRPHRTGWCSVFPENKAQLDSPTIEDAYVECREKGYPLFGETPNTRSL